MNDCKPDIMTAVPRFYQNIYKKINSNFNKTKGLKKYLISKMLYLGNKKIRGKSLKRNLEKQIPKLEEKTEVKNESVSNQEVLE